MIESKTVKMKDNIESKVNNSIILKEEQPTSDESPLLDCSYSKLDIQSNKNKLRIRKFTKRKWQDVNKSLTVNKSASLLVNKTKELQNNGENSQSGVLDCHFIKKINENINMKKDDKYLLLNYSLL